MALGQMVSTWEQSKPAFDAFPAIKGVLIWEILGSTALLIYSFIVGCVVWSGHPRGRDIARRLLVVRPLAFIGVEGVAFLMMRDLPSEILQGGIAGALGAIFQVCVHSLVWWFYFKKSKRVRNTYGPERE